MLKKVLLLLLFSLNCLANQPIKCSDISQKLTPQAIMMITNICNSSYFNKNVRFITNTSNVDVEQWINKLFFIIINEKSNIALSPYNTIFRKISILPNASVASYKGFISSSQAEKLPNYSWLPSANISSLISADIATINNMFNSSELTNLQMDTQESTKPEINSDDYLVETAVENLAKGVSDCNHLSPKTPLGTEIMIKNICNSTHFNKNIRFIATTATDFDVDEWIAKGFFIIIHDQYDFAIIPYNTIFKQIALLPSAHPYNYRKLFASSVAENKLPFNWLKQVENVSALVATDSFNVIDMFTGVKPYTMPIFPSIITLKPETAKNDFFPYYALAYSLTMAVGVTVVLGLVYYKFSRANKRKDYILI